MSSAGYHEPIEELSDETSDMHSAIVYLLEELKDNLFTKKPIAHL
jgi:uncharacterized protein